MSIYIIAIATPALILTTFLINKIRSKRKKPGKDDLWTAEGYYNLLRARIMAAKDMDTLQKEMDMVDMTWYTKTFRFPINRFKRNKMYIKLCDVYATKETDLINKSKIAIQIPCEN